MKHATPIESCAMTFGLTKCEAAIWLVAQSIEACTGPGAPARKTDLNARVLAARDELRAELIEQARDAGATIVRLVDDNAKGSREIARFEVAR